jgi:DNA-binding beta-propeller fold protein YncE
VSIAASNVNVLVGVQHIDGMTASARLLVFDRYNLATAAKTIPLKRVVATVCVSPDGTRAFVVDADRANPAVFLIDVNAGQITKTIAFNDPSMWAAAFSADTERLVVIGARTATVIDTSAFAVLGQATLSPSGLAVALSPDGGTACVSSCLTVDPGTSNSVCVIDLADLAAAPDAFRFDNVANTPGPPVFTADNVQALVTAAGKSTILTLRRVPTGGTP